MKTVLINGATGGIGKSVALLLAGAGVRVILLGRDVNKLTILASEIADRSGACEVYVARTDDFGEVERVSTEIADKNGKIDWLINASGFISDKGLLEDETENTVMTTFQVNIFSVIYLTKFFIPLLTHSGGIINISSTAGISGNGRYSIYSASKAAVNTFTQATARQITDMDLSAIAICPGPTNTSMRERIAGDAQLQQSPEVISEVVLSIIQGTSPYKNGDIVIVRDGSDKLHSGLSA